MDEVEFYGDDGKVAYSIFDGEVFTEEDYDSLVEQGEFSFDNLPLPPYTGVPHHLLSK